jgi:hypothetical protein
MQSPTIDANVQAIKRGATMRKPSNQDARLRMEARARLADPSRPPSFSMVFVEPPERDAKDNVIGPARECDAWTATMNGGGLPDRNYERRPDESLEQFKARVEEDFSVNSNPQFVLYGLEKEKPATALEMTH